MRIRDELLQELLGGKMVGLGDDDVGMICLLLAPVLGQRNKP